MFFLECIGCRARYDPNEVVYSCSACGDLLEVNYDYINLAKHLDIREWRQRSMSVWRYVELLPVLDRSLVVSLNEGGTRIHECRKLAEEIGIKRLFLKNEGDNPTGSFKDRGMTVGITRARELGAKSVICASTGNTSASLAAYAARAGLKCLVLIPSGKIAAGKLAQAIIYGAKVLQVQTNFDGSLRLAIEMARLHKGFYLLNSGINPFRIEGQRTLAYEICEQLLYHSPDLVVVPVGNAGNISAIWKGFREFNELNLIGNFPRILAVQAENASPIATAIKQDREKIEPVENPETLASAIRIGRPISWKKALAAIRDSRGMAETVTDEQIVAAQKLLAKTEGLFVEPASASCLAGLKKIVQKGQVDRDSTVVCIATGHGLKDPETAVKYSAKPVEVAADISEIEKQVAV
ncbi:MAG: threonine synthase [Candidatus Bathyarchaeia archaeon]